MGYHVLPLETFISQCRNVSWGTFQCLRKLRISKSFMNNRDYHDFAPKTFSLILSEIFVGQPF